MSILLDAITREKQQQQTVSDVAMQSVQFSSAPQNGVVHRRIKHMLLLVVTIVLGVAVAWGVNFALKPAALENSSVQALSGSSVVTKPESEASTVSASTATQHSPSAVTLAGKVALPLAKPYVASSTNVPLSANVASSANTRFPANDIPLDVADALSAQNEIGSLDESISLAQLQALSEQYDQQLDVGADSAHSMREQTRKQSTMDARSAPESLQQDAIVLGANANQRGLDELAALRLQVNHAAEEVNFSAVKQQEVERNNLMQAFEAALKEVEYERSANADVTASELDPIPAVQDKVLPNYGQLPASLQLQVPEFSINAHVYSSDPTQRWLNVDGVELQQGDKIQDKMTIIEIRPRDVILDIDGTEFKVPAI